MEDRSQNRASRTGSSIQDRNINQQHPLNMQNQTGALGGRRSSYRSTLRPGLPLGHPDIIRHQRMSQPPSTLMNQATPQYNTYNTPTNPMMMHNQGQTPNQRMMNSPFTSVPSLSPNNELAAEFAAEVAKRQYPSMDQEENRPRSQNIPSTFLQDEVKEYLDGERPSTNKHYNVEDMLTELDSLHGNLGTSREPCISTKSATRRKMYYDRQTLMSMRCHPLALRRPRGLPDIPDILLDKPRSDVCILDEGYEPTNGYFLPTTMFSPMKQKAKQQSKQQKKVNKNVDISIDIPLEVATELPESNVSTSTYITTEEIPGRENPFIDEVLEVSGKKGQPMETHDTHLLCDLCQSDGEHVKAQHYCPECNEFLCQICAKVHKKSRASKHHVLQDQHDMPTAKLMDFAELACTKHHGETIKYFCKNHDQGCCTLCITTEHNKCKFDYIEDIGRNYEESDEFKLCIQMIKDIEEQLKENIQKSNGCAEIVRQNFEQVMADINTFREVINKKVDDLEKVTREEMMKVKNREIARLDTLTAKCQSMTDKLAKLKNDLDEIKKYKQRKQLVLSTRKGQTQVSAYVGQLKTISAELKVEPYTFVRNMELLASLDRQKDFGVLFVPKKVETCFKGRSHCRPNQLVQARSSDRVLIELGLQE